MRITRKLLAAYVERFLKNYASISAFLAKDNQIKELELRLEKAVKDKQSDFMALAQEMLERIKKLEQEYKN